MVSCSCMIKISNIQIWQRLFEDSHFFSFEKCAFYEIRLEFQSAEEFEILFFLISALIETVKRAAVPHQRGNTAAYLFLNGACNIVTSEPTGNNIDQVLQDLLSLPLRRFET